MNTLRNSTARRRRDRGATAIEYALGLALVVAALIGSIQALQNEGEQELGDTGDRVGVVDDNAYYADPNGSGLPPSTNPPTSLPPPAPENTIHIAAMTATPPPQDNDSDPTTNSPKWIAFASISITDGNGEDLGGVQVSGTATLPAGGADFEWTCTTNSTGTCSPVPQRSDINDNKTTVVFTVTAITKSGYTWTASPSDAPPVTVDCTTVVGVC